MSASPATNASNKQSSPGNESESSGFKSFWKSSNKTENPSNVTFVQQDPAPKRAASKIGRIFKRGSTASAANSEGKNEPKNRRQQVYNAQKRHRNRKAEYVQSLEAEIARLQHMDSEASSQKNALAHQNQTMRGLLASHSVEYQLETSSLNAPAEQLSQLGGANLDVRFDPDIGHQRTFLDLPDANEMDWTSSSNATSASQSATPPTAPANTAVARKLVKGDSWAAVEFILALEWPCQGHIPHAHINPDAKPMVADEEGGYHGHALTATASVYGSALPPQNESSHHGKLPNGTPTQSEEKWQLPHSEIDKLIKMSENLPLDDEDMTPAQAYSATREAVSEDQDLKPALDALKLLLASSVGCKGLGAVLPASVFWKHLDSTLGKLKTKQ